MTTLRLGSILRREAQTGFCFGGDNPQPLYLCALW